MDGFIGEIRPFAFGFVPRGWLSCTGQQLPIASFPALFSLLGTTYGGNGTTNFLLPNLAGITPVGSGVSPTTGPWPLGGQTGKEQVALTASEIPAHNHTVTMETVPPAGGQNNTLAIPVGGSSWLSHPLTITPPDHVAVIFSMSPATSGNPDTTLNPSTVGIAGSSAPHENRQPYLAIQYCICNEGLFPTPS